MAVDAYSGFASNEYLGFSELPRLLYGEKPRGRAIDTVVVCGLATDYCVGSTAIDAVKFNFRTLLSRDTMRGFDPVTTSKALVDMQTWGCEICDDTDALLALLG